MFESLMNKLLIFWLLSFLKKIIYTLILILPTFKKKNNNVKVKIEM